MPLLMRAARRQGMLGAMGNPFGITLDRAWTEWAAKHGVSAKVAAALILISQARPLDDIVAKLTTHELEQVIKLVGRCPSYYPPRALDVLKSKSNLVSLQPPAERLSRNGALEFGQPAARTNPGTEHSRRIHVRQRADRYNRLGPPKSKAGTRTIPLSPLLLNTLKAWRLASPPSELDLVFPNGAGRIENHSNLLWRVSGRSRSLPASRSCAQRA